MEGGRRQEIQFAWQGGEPTLLGVDFFRKVVRLQQHYANGKTISNALQTNGTLLNDEWGEFLTANKFLVGVSIDGPAELHDVYRVDKRQRPTFDRVMAGLDYLKKHGTEFNTLTVIYNVNVKHPLKVYRFLKEIGSTFLQFIPLVERKADTGARKIGLTLAVPPPPGESVTESPVTRWSVPSLAYGKFLTAIYDEWIKQDVGEIFVQMFDVALGNWMGRGSALCVFAETCGRCLAMEHNGDVYACDHYVYPKYKLGNLMNQSLGEMVDSPEQQQFGMDKKTSLPRQCRECPVLFACNGGCPKHRFIHTSDGEPGLNYLCSGYYHFFKHMDPSMRQMARLINAGRPASDIMAYAKLNQR